MLSSTVSVVIGALGNVPLPIALIIVGFGILVLFISIGNLYKVKASKTWLSTTGNIISSEMETKINRARRRRTVTYNAAVAYDYLAEGIKYSGNKVRFGGYGSSNANRERQILNRYPVGKQVTVYYNPSKPEDSVLERRLASTVYIALVAGCVLLALGLLLTVKYFKA